MFNVKGIFKGLPSELAIAGGIALSGKALALIPFSPKQPAIKPALGYLLLKLVGGKIKGLPGDALNGLKLGFAANLIGTGLAKVGVAGIDQAYVAGIGSDRFIQIDVPTVGQSVSPSYIQGTGEESFQAAF